jgi:two-component system phosphate regulon sensor histidine kinase PhoR
MASKGNNKGNNKRNNKRGAKRRADGFRGEREALMERCGAGVLVLDPERAILRANETASRLFGLPSEALVGQIVAPPFFPDEMGALVETALAGRSSETRQIPLRSPQMGVAIVSVSSVAGERRKRPRLLVIIQDVTELRRLETVRRDFVANVSHEMRTPLASIRAMAETLQDGGLHDAVVADSFLGTIVTEVERLARITSDLLILSDAESRVPEKAHFSLSVLLENAIRRFRSQANKAHVALTADVPASLDIQANIDQIEQVIVNLIDNAIKYTPAGGSVRVSARPLAREGAASAAASGRPPQNGGVTVEVADTGIGIAPKHLPRLFERFYRVDKARSRQSGGTGLGLAIVKHIVEAHGGRITVHSEPKRGSTFAVTLPNYPPDAADDTVLRH